MYLCNLALVGKPMPQSLPERIRNEVSSMVDIISFGVPDDQPQRPASSNAPSFSEPPKPQQPSNSQLLSSLAPQPTAAPYQQSFQPQPTGFPGQQQSFQPQPTGFQPQPTGFPQATGYDGPRPPMPPMPTGFGQPGPAPLNAQPTGAPGQWGLVNAPQSGLPNIDALRAQMMPQPGREGGFTTTGLRGNAQIPWAITKPEKKIYDDLFKAWDGFNKGYVTGGQAIEIFGQSGLDKKELETIWTLADPHNRGRLDLDEFAVAMHLIYRRLNGYPIPNKLPAELVPPSTRNLTSSLGSIKSMLSRDAEERKNNMNYLEPQKTGVSYLKSHSFGSGANGSRKDATVFKNNDDDVGYRSSARRRVGGGGDRSPSPAQAGSSDNVAEMSIEQLEKRIREQQVILDAMDFQDENDADAEEAQNRRDRKEAERLYDRIRDVQQQIDSHPNASFVSGNSEAERRTLKRQLQSLQDRLPELASQVRKTEKAIADSRLELFRLKDAKEHPSNAAPVVGTGPGGIVTESDRLKARAKAMMQQRSAALAGKPMPADSDDSAAASRRFEEENSKVRTERDNNDRMVRDVEDGVSTYSRSVEDSLKGVSTEGEDHERRRWEDGLGVEDEVRNFIYDLQRGSRAATARREEAPRNDRGRAEARKPEFSSPSISSPAPAPESSRASPAPAGGSYASYKTPEERAAFIKQQAEQRMAERLAKLGLRAPSKGETAQQKAEREAKERSDRQAQADAEDARLEAERQKRLESEQIKPPSAVSGKKAPPAPPSRQPKPEHKARASQSGVEIREQQEAFETSRKSLE